MAKADLKADAPFRVALVGAETMLGKDIQETLETRSKRTRVTAYAASGEGTFGKQDGEAVYVEPFDAKRAADERVVVLAGTAEGARKSFEAASKAAVKPVVVDALGVLEGAALRAPLLGEVKAKAGEAIELAHPAASALALTMGRLAKYQAPVRAVATVLEPASERGQRGISELHKQTAALLAFKPLPKEIFDAQLAFNTLARLGEDAAVKLEDLEGRIQRQTALLAAQAKTQAAVAQLSLRLVQAPVFHGYSISLFVEFGAKADARAVEEALGCAQIEVRGLGDETPDAVAAAASSGLVAGDVRVDARNSKAVWIWLVFDNLRLVSDGVADIVAVMQQERA